MQSFPCSVVLPLIFYFWTPSFMELELISVQIFWCPAWPDSHIGLIWEFLTWSVKAKRERKWKWGRDNGWNLRYLQFHFLLTFVQPKNDSEVHRVLCWAFRSYNFPEIIQYLMLRAGGKVVLANVTSFCGARFCFFVLTHHIIYIS